MSLIYHPENGKPLVDRFGEFVRLGDRVIIAKKKLSYGNGAAALFEGTIKKITPLMLHPRYGGYDPKQWHGPTSARVPLVREDQLPKSHQTEYGIRVSQQAPPDWQRCYVVGVDVPGMDRLINVAFGENVIAVPS